MAKPDFSEDADCGFENMKTEDFFTRDPEWVLHWRIWEQYGLPTALLRAWHLSDGYITAGFRRRMEVLVLEVVFEMAGKQTAAQMVALLNDERGPKHDLSDKLDELRREPVVELLRSAHALPPAVRRTKAAVYRRVAELTGHTPQNVKKIAQRYVNGAVDRKPAVK